MNHRSKSFLVSLLVGELMWLGGGGVEAGVVAYTRCFNSVDGTETALCDLDVPDAVFYQVPCTSSCANLCGQYNISSENPFTDSESIRNSLYTETRFNDTTILFTSKLPDAFTTFGFEKGKNILMFGKIRFRASTFPPVDLANKAFHLGCVAFNYEKHTHTCSLFENKPKNNLSIDSNVTNIFYDWLILTGRILVARRPSGYSCSHYRMFVYPGQSCFIGKAHCEEYGLKSQQDNGVYYLSTSLGVRPVYCHYSLIQGSPVIGMLIQRRLTGLENFNHGWTDYENGFGDLEGEHWLGNKYISSFTTSQNLKLVVEVVALDGSWAYAKYETFVVAPSTSQYKLTVSGYTGTAGDALAYHNGMKFSAPDRDNDRTEVNCALGYSSGWWFKWCYNSNLNGLMIGPGSDHVYAGAQWETYKGKNKECLMKLIL